MPIDTAGAKYCEQQLSVDPTEIGAYRIENVTSPVQVMAASGTDRRTELDLARHEIDRRRALDAAATLFSGQGFDGSAMSEIAREAGLSLKALYGVFPSKEELFEAVIADRYEQHVLPLLCVDRGALPPAERVFALVDEVLAAMDADRAFLLLYARGSAGVPAKLRAAGRDPYTPYIEAVRDHLVGAIAACRTEINAVKAHDLAVALTASLVALATTAFCTDPPRAVLEVRTTLREIFGPLLGLREFQSPIEQE